MNSFNTAFVPSAGLVGTTSFIGARSNTTSPRRPGRALVPTAVLSGDKRAFTSKPYGDNENARARRESAYTGPQGWTPYAEKVNGRLAQLGFVIGLVTEIASGKPIGTQILIMFSPFIHLVQAIAHLN